jgi:hypothetical protein
MSLQGDLSVGADITVGGSFNGTSAALFICLFGLDPSQRVITLINELQQKTVNISFSGTTTTISNRLSFTGTLNNITPTVFSYLTGCT